MWEIFHNRTIIKTVLLEKKKKHEIYWEKRSSPRSEIKSDLNGKVKAYCIVCIDHMLPMTDLSESFSVAQDSAHKKDWRGWWRKNSSRTR